MSSKTNHHHHINGHDPIPPPCPHLADFRSRNGTKPFHLFQNCLRIKPPHGRASIRRDPSEVPRCGACGVSSAPRIYACVTCAAISCHAPPEPSHAAAHAAAMAPGHEISVDVDRAELFCCACRDYVYDRDFDAAVVLSSKANYIHSNVNSDNLRKKRRIVEYRPWLPDSQERVLVNNNSSVLSFVEDRPWGLRGLNNLGNTCFMNSVLQALLHTPPLRNYFLSDKHNRYYCQQQKKSGNDNGVVGGKRSNGGDGNGGKGLRLCLACDMDAIFSAVFSGELVPYSPAKFLYSWWQHAANLASYEQQDAHEFFISMLDGIHEKVEKDRHKPHSLGCGLRSHYYCLGVEQALSDLGLILNINLLA